MRTPELAAPVAVDDRARRVLRLDDEPLRVATSLLRQRLVDTQLLYERDGEFRIGLGVRAQLVAGPVTATLHTDDRLLAAEVHGNPLAAVAQLLDTLSIPAWSGYGWANFELAYAVAGLPVPGDEPLLHVLVPRTEVLIRPGQATILSTDESELDIVEAALLRPTGEPAYQTLRIPFDRADPHYLDAVAGSVAAIRAGELEKVILSREVALDGPIDLFGSYLTGRRNNTPARSFVVDTPQLRAVGFSPETVLELDSNGRVRTQPLAGTRARTGDPAVDARLRAELTTDAKEIFEHAISVKVAHQELSRICRPDSVAVHDFMAVKDRGAVQHLGSTVVGQLPEPAEPDAGSARSWATFGTLFPAVTASGVPKTAAYRVIRAHERSTRGLYAGSVFTTDHTGAIDAALVLRTAFSTGERTWLRAGAGIVGQSRPAREFTETCEKLASVARYLVRT